MPRTSVAKRRLPQNCANCHQPIVPPQQFHFDRENMHRPVHENCEEAALLVKNKKRKAVAVGVIDKPKPVAPPPPKPSVKRAIVVIPPPEPEVLPEPVVEAPPIPAEPPSMPTVIERVHEAEWGQDPPEQEFNWSPLSQAAKPTPVTDEVSVAWYKRKDNRGFHVDFAVIFGKDVVDLFGWKEGDALRVLKDFKHKAFLVEKTSINLGKQLKARSTTTFELRVRWHEWKTPGQLPKPCEWTELKGSLLLKNVSLPPTE